MDRGREGRARPKSTRLVPILAVVCLTLLTGCLAAQVDLEVGSDGAGTLAVEVFPSDEFRARLTDLDLDDVERLSRSGGAEVSISEIGTIGRRGYRIEVPFDDYRVLDAAGEDGVRFAGTDLRVFNAFGLDEVDGSWTLLAELRPLDEIGVLLGDAFGVGAVDRRPDVALSVTLPGKVVSSNADERTGGTARWELDFAPALNPANSPTPMHMRTEPVPLVTPLQWALAAIIGVVLIGFALVIVGSNRSVRSTRRRRRWKRRGANGDTGWSKEPVDAPKDGQPVAAPPLPWQTHKPGEAEPPRAPGPPAPSTPQPQQVAGWYEDPSGSARHRWWDGERWTDHTS